MYDFNSNCAGIYEESCNIIDRINKDFSKFETTTWNPNIRMFIEKLNHDQLKKVEILSNKKLLEQVGKFPLNTIDLSKTSFEYADNKKISIKSQFYGCVNKTQSTYTDDSGLTRVKIGDKRDPNDYYAVALVEAYAKDAHNQLLNYPELGINEEYEEKRYGGYKLQVTLADKSGEKYTINAITFDTKAARERPTSLYFPKDGLGIGHHNHVLEFIYASKLEKNNASSDITTGGNVDLQKLLNSNNGPLEVHSVSAYIDKPLVIGDYNVGYSDEYEKYRLGR